MKLVGMFEAKTQFSALVEAVQNGESILITKNGKPVAQLSPVARQPPREFGFDRELFSSGVVALAEDFDELPPQLLKALYGA